MIDIQRQTHALSQGGGVNIEAMDYTGGTEPVQILAAIVPLLYPDLAGLLNFSHPFQHNFRVADYKASDNAGIIARWVESKF